MRPVTLQTDLNRYEDIPLKRLHPGFGFICKFEKSKAILSLPESFRQL